MLHYIYLAAGRPWNKLYVRAKAPECRFQPYRHWHLDACLYTPIGTGNLSHRIDPGRGIMETACIFFLCCYNQVTLNNREVCALVVLFFVVYTGVPGF